MFRSVLVFPVLDVDALTPLHTCYYSFAHMLLDLYPKTREDRCLQKSFLSEVGRAYHALKEWRPGTLPTIQRLCGLKWPLALSGPWP